MTKFFQINNSLIFGVNNLSKILLTLRNHLILLKVKFAKSRAMRASVVHVPRANVPTCQKRANFSFLRANVPTCQYRCQRTKGEPVFQLEVPTCQYTYQSANLANSFCYFPNFIRRVYKGLLGNRFEKRASCNLITKLL